jgi:hypothetical protein
MSSTAFSENTQGTEIAIVLDGAGDLPPDGVADRMGARFLWSGS